MIKPAFCFLIYDRITNEDRWARFFDAADASRYTLHVHAKTPQPELKHSRFQRAVLADPVPTEYGHWTIIAAMNRLAREALMDPAVTHIVFVSQACVPLKSFEHVCHFLTRGVSYFNRAPQAQCFPRAAALLQWYPKEWIQKQSQWCILARTHAAWLVDQEHEYIDRYKTIVSAEEHGYVTELYRAGRVDELQLTPNLAAGATTFTNWQGMDYPWPSNNGLKNYDTVSVEEWEFLVKSPALFGRKFNGVV